MGSLTLCAAFCEDSEAGREGLRVRPGPITAWLPARAGSGLWVEACLFNILLFGRSWGTSARA